MGSLVELGILADVMVEMAGCSLETLEVGIETNPAEAESKPLSEQFAEGRLQA